MFTEYHAEGGAVQSTQWLGLLDRMTEISCFDSRRAQDIFLVSKSSIMGIGPTQPHIPDVTTLFRAVKLNTQLHIVQRWIMRGATPLLHHMVSMRYSAFHLMTCVVLGRSTVQISDRKSVITKGFRPFSQSLLLDQLFLP